MFALITRMFYRSTDKSWLLGWLPVGARVVCSDLTRAIEKAVLLRRS
jgi:hypothetical protein